MSKKKEKRIKRLQRKPIWSAIVGLVLVEAIIMTLSMFICTVTVFGILNTIILNTVKNCRTVVQSVNQNWNQKSREQIEARLKTFTEIYSDIDDILIDEKFTFISSSPEFKSFYDEDNQEVFKKEGAVHFVDDYTDNNLFLDIGFHKTSNLIYEDGEEEGIVQYFYTVSDDDNTFLYDLKRFFSVFDLDKTIQDQNYINWANSSSAGIHLVSVYRTAIPGVNICFKNSLRLNTFQFNLICTVILFLIVVIMFTGFYELSKVIAMIHERKRINKIVMLDTVTGGYNKDYFIQKAGKEIKRSRRQYAVVQLRLEKYRNYCTAYGLKQGENLLEEINCSLVEMIGKKEYVAHVEKSDFALLLNYQNFETLEIRIKNMMNILRERRGGQHLTFSVGICPVVSKGDDISVVLNCAGIAVPKEIKTQDEIVFFNDSMKEEQVWERRIEDDMEKALENHEFNVYLQPKYSTKKEELSAAEALVRWTHPVLGFISPGKFIPIFERNGFILQLDDYMLTEVAKLQSHWLELGRKLVPISVNVSRAHFAEDNLAEHICSIVDKYKVPHEFIELELTESAFFDDKFVLLTTVRKLKEFGFKVSMDDFGAGYSSLNSLKELPLDIIKLDAEFFRSVDDIERSNLIVGQTISLAKKLGMEIVAEGIETREQVDFLAEQHCDLIQGFYFSKPLPINEFEERAYPQAKAVD